MAEEQPTAPEEPFAVKISVIQKPINYYGMEDVVPIFAELAAVRHSEQVFSLFFFQTAVPITEDPEILAEMQNVPAKCIARIVLTPNLMGELYTAMGTNMQNWEKLMHARKQEIEKATSEKEGEK